MGKKHILGLELKTLMNMMRRAAEEKSMPQDCCDLTSTQAAVMEYLMENKGKDVFQKDLESCFQIRRSTITGILQGMERRGLIRRELAAHDARLKRLILTERAEAVCLEVEERFRYIEDRAMEGVSEEEKEVFFSVMDQMKQNLMETEFL